ncbi:MAG: ATP-binding cassette domain-containing protein [Candidatus Taylorbacteria bacterium]|nr:ATP-binding cassette domain-containing protein [Candidatus Taylorbacteria bacterium]
MKVLETKNLIKRFDGVHAVDRLSLCFEKGQTTGLIGPNGSGKSTFVNLLSGMMPFDEGTVMVAGVETLEKIRAHEVADLGITRTFQDVRLFEQMPVLDNILIVLTKRTILGALLKSIRKFI